MYGLEAVRNILATLWLDKMDLTSIEETHAESVTNNVYPAQPQRENLACRLSFDSKDTPNPEPYDNDEVVVSGTIFCDKHVEVKSGTRITVRRYTEAGKLYQTFEFEVSDTGRANVWESHQEIKVVMIGDA